MTKSTGPELIERLRRPVRTALFFGIAAFIYFAPVPHQVFGTQPHGLPRWRMFGGMSLQHCAGHYEQVQGEERHLLDRYALLGFTAKKKPGRNDRSIKNLKQARAIGTKLCKKLGPEADVRVHMRCPSFKRGWVVKARGEKNLCLPGYRPEEAKAAPVRAPVRTRPRSAPKLQRRHQKPAGGKE